ncbi:unnamed protein product [Mucor fragilis]
MSNWNQAQQQQPNSSADVSDEYTSEEYTDDEYEPIEATAWGSQSIAEDGSTNVSLSISGWQSLIDPNIKTKAGGIGSGQLHRRGANYQPVDEQAIIDRRLGKPIPKGGLGGSKKKKPKKPKAAGGAFPLIPEDPCPTLWPLPRHLLTVEEKQLLPALGDLLNSPQLLSGNQLPTKLVMDRWPVNMPLLLLLLPLLPLLLAHKLLAHKLLLLLLLL